MIEDILMIIIFSVIGAICMTEYVFRQSKLMLIGALLSVIGLINVIVF